MSLKAWLLLLAMENKISNLLLIILITLSFIGFIDAAFLAIEHYRGEIPPCSISFLNGCETVTTSQYAVVLGVPIALVGAVYYLIVIVLLIAYWDLRKTILLKLALLLTGLGFLASLYLIYLQIFVLKALCQYCLISAGSSTLLFIILLALGLIFYLVIFDF